MTCSDLKLGYSQVTLILTNHASACRASLGPTQDLIYYSRRGDGWFGTDTSRRPIWVYVFLTASHTQGIEKTTSFEKAKHLAKFKRNRQVHTSLSLPEVKRLFMFGCGAKGRSFTACPINGVQGTREEYQEIAEKQQ